MDKPPEDATDEGTVLLPSGFQRSLLERGQGTTTSGLWARTARTPVPGNTLPLGTRLGEFELTRVIGEGGFGIVYEAWDTSLERRVAVKEYMPTELAERVGGLQVRSLSEEDEEVFQRGLHSFINEGKILARFDNASLVKVYRFWEANGTGYMVMPFYEGPTFLDALRKLRKPPDEAWLLSLLDPLTQALAVIHDQHVYHRDIAPDNILLLAGSGRPLLLDFGAARRVINDANQKAPTAIVKPGYAPVEQYSDVHMKQGPWSDVYALAAVLHFAITGKKPPAAIGRLAGDSYVPLSTLAAGRYSPALLAAIDRALIVKPNERIQSMDAFRAALGLAPLARDSAGMLIATGSAPAGFDPTLGTEPEAQPSTKSRRAATNARAAQEAGVGRAPAAPGSSRVGWMAGVLAAVVGVLILVGGGVWWFVSGSEPGTAQAPASGPVVAPAAPTLPAPPPTSAATDVAKAPDGNRLEAPPPATTPTQAFNVADEFERIRAQGTPNFSVAIQWKAKPVFRIKNKDVLAMNLTSTQDGYLYVLVHTPDDILFQYFPNSATPANFVKEYSVTKIPRAATDPATQVLHEGIVLTDPPGKGRVLAIVSKYPRDFSALGGKRESIYPLYPVGPEAESLQRQAGGGRSIYLGQVKCPQGLACEDQFGAATDSFDIVP